MYTAPPGALRIAAGQSLAEKYGRTGDCTYPQGRVYIPAPGAAPASPGARRPAGRGAAVW